MTGPRSDPKDVKGADKRRLDQALEEGLEETFPGSRQAQGLARPLADVGNRDKFLY